MHHRRPSYFATVILLFIANMQILQLKLKSVQNPLSPNLQLAAERCLFLNAAV